MRAAEKFAWEIMLLLILTFLVPTTRSQFEGSMNVHSNLEEQQRPILPQCPGQWSWACRNGECIPSYDVCDGTVQCSDGSDEWNCQQQQGAGWRQPVGHSYDDKVNGPPPKPPSTLAPTTTTTAASESSYVVLTTGQLFTSLIVFTILCFIVVYVIKRRARGRQTFRNRRGNFIQAQDSDEDDILISSMYSS